jgi:multiple sugar transport system permease protein
MTPRGSTNLPASYPGFRARRRQEAALAYLLLLPSALILGAFGFWPLVNAGWLSLREWHAVPGGFVGLANYRQAFFAEPAFWKSLQVTVWYVLGTVPATLILGFGVAELLLARIRGLGLYRTLFFLPYVVSPVAAAAVWKWIYHPSFGLANAVTAPLGLHFRWLYEDAGLFRLGADALRLPWPAWADGPSLALVCIIGVSVWQSLGFAVVILLAGLAAITEDLTDAARLDGARGWALIRHVRLPLVSPTLFFLTIVLTIRAFQSFTQIYILSPDGRGGPNETTRNITLYIVQSFNENAARLGPGYGAAVAMVLFGIILLLTLLQFRVLGTRVHYQ